MPKTKKENKIEINSKGKELEEIVNAIIIECDNTIVKWKKEEDDRFIDSCIDVWNIEIDNIPVELTLKCRVHRFTLNNNSPENNNYKLVINANLDWNGNIYIDEEMSNLINFIYDVKVKKDVIDRNDITRHIMDLFNINDLRYCKIQNILHKKGDLFSKVVNYFDLKCTNVEECCVCYDKTKTRTKMCRHYLCLECVSKMKTITRRHCLNYFNCPMCKAEVNEMVSLASNCDSDSD